jgi:uncharacterized membrane protein YwzB
MITFSSKQTRTLMMFVSLVLGFIVAFWPKPSFFTDRRFARTGG